MPKLTSKAKVQLIRKLYAAGVPYREIARRAKVSNGLISSVTGDLPGRLKRGIHVDGGPPVRRLMVRYSNCIDASMLMHHRMRMAEDMMFDRDMERIVE